MLLGRAWHCTRTLARTRAAALCDLAPRIRLIATCRSKCRSGHDRHGDGSVRVGMMSCGRAMVGHGCEDRACHRRAQPSAVRGSAAPTEVNSPRSPSAVLLGYFSSGLVGTFANAVVSATKRSMGLCTCHSVRPAPAQSEVACAAQCVQKGTHRISANRDVTGVECVIRARPPRYETSPLSSDRRGTIIIRVGRPRARRRPRPKNCKNK